ncbi:MAG: hypothetical protein AAF960_17470 [Bacteroidota bacterium]
MKYLLTCLCYFTLFSLNAQNIKLTKIKINPTEKYPVKGFLYDVDDEKVVLATDRKYIKQYLITGNCKTCHTVQREFIRDLRCTNRKSFLPIGTMTSLGLGLVLVAAADGTPNPDGPNARYWAQLYALAGLGIGVGTDLVRVINHFDKKNRIDINMGLSSVLKSKSAVQQFKNQQAIQLDELSIILNEISSNKKKHRKKVTIYTKDKNLLKGYILGQWADSLLISPDRVKLLAYRRNPPNHLSKVRLQDILYYEFK